MYTPHKKVIYTITETPNMLLLISTFQLSIWQGEYASTYTPVVGIRENVL